ncbi:MAG: hypothetical protein HS107_08445 [Thermoflexaceae bacterium]|nr:hypothetical protein [Thermoflexaceae bacterium]
MQRCAPAVGGHELDTYCRGSPLALCYRPGRAPWHGWLAGCLGDGSDPDADGLPHGGRTAADVAIEQFEGTSIVCGHVSSRPRAATTSRRWQ